MPPYFDMECPLITVVTWSVQRQESVNIAWRNPRFPSLAFACPVLRLARYTSKRCNTKLRVLRYLRVNQYGPSKQPLSNLRERRVVIL